MNLPEVQVNGTHNATTHSTPYSEISGAILQTTTECNTCPRVARSLDPFHSLSLFLDPTCSTLEQLIRQQWQPLEIDDYFCEACGAREHCKTDRPVTTPQVLVLHLKRWMVTGRAPHFRHKKIDRFIRFDPTLHLPTQKKRGYTLRSVIVHSGGAGSGHYTSFIRTDESQWYFCDDYEIPSKTTERQVLAASAYMLFYERAPP